jgi:predicted peroxiredoxin
MNLSWGMPGAHDLSHMYDQFISAGGKVLVCPMCAKNTGLDKKNLRPGAKISKDNDEIATALLHADKILSY